MWQAEFKLYLYPIDPELDIDTRSLTTLLSDLQFIGEKLSEKRFATGDKFDALLTFMGCSPNIELEPQENSAYCYIEIESANQPIFIYGKNTKFPACPHCKTNLKITLIDSKPETCSHCNNSLGLAELNWRKSALFAKTWIAIGNIYELEAIPNDQLLEQLEKLTKVKWKFAYIRKAV